jgi:hypothetical protein
MTQIRRPDGHVYEVPEVVGGSLILEARPCDAPEAWAPAVRDLGTVFRKEGYGRVKEPLVVGEVDAEGWRGLRATYTRVLDMPIRFPGTEYRLPTALAGLVPVLQRMIDAEHAVNRDVDAYHAYLTVDSGVVAAGTTQRAAGLHADGFQGPRIQPKRAIDHNYLAYSAAPTAFYPGPFDVADLD